MADITIYSRDPVIGAWIPNHTKKRLRDAEKHRDALLDFGYDVQIVVDGRTVVYDSTEEEDLDI